MGPEEAGSTSSGGDGGGVSSVGGAETEAATACSICLEAVGGGGGRSVAKLQCGHEFHLDCIGSAFNAKGVMQCPNCRRVEEGNWLNATRGFSLPELIVDDWTHDEDLYDLNNSEMSSALDWWRGLTQPATSFEEEESSLPLAYYEHFGYHLRPQFPANQPLQPSYSPNPHFSSENLLVSPAYHHHWSRAYEPPDAQISHALPAVGPHYSGWEPHLPYSGPNIHTGSGDHAPLSSANGTPRLDSDGLPRGGGALFHTSTLRHVLGSRAGSSIAPLATPLYVGIPCPYVNLCMNYHHQNSPAMPAPVPGLHQSGGTPSWGLQDAEGTVGGCFYARESDHPPFIQYMPVGGCPAWWGREATDASNSSSRTETLPHHSSEASGGSEGSSPHTPRMHHFI